jgi:hypothetical protein
MHSSDSQNPKDSTTNQAIQYIESLAKETHILDGYLEVYKKNSYNKMCEVSTYNEEAARIARLFMFLEMNFDRNTNNFIQYDNTITVGRGAIDENGIVALRNHSLSKISNHFFYFMSVLDKLENRELKFPLPSIDTFTVSQFMDLIYTLEARLEAHKSSLRESFVFLKTPSGFNIDEQAVNAIELENEDKIKNGADLGGGVYSEPTIKYVKALSLTEDFKNINAAFVLVGDKLYHFDKEKHLYKQLVDGKGEILKILQNEVGNLAPGVLSQPLSRMAREKIYVASGKIHPIHEIDMLKDNFSELKKIVLPYLKSRQILSQAALDRESYLSNGNEINQETFGKSLDRVNVELEKLKKDSASLPGVSSFKEKEANNLAQIKEEIKNKLKEQDEKEEEAKVVKKRQKQEEKAAQEKKKQDEAEKKKAEEKANLENKIKYTVYKHKTDANIYLVVVPNGGGCNLWRYNSDSKSTSYYNHQGEQQYNLAYVSESEFGSDKIVDLIKKFENESVQEVQSSIVYDVGNQDDVKERVVVAVGKYNSSQKKTDLTQTTTSKPKPPTAPLPPKPTTAPWVPPVETSTPVPLVSSSGATTTTPPLPLTETPILTQTSSVSTPVSTSSTSTTSSTPTITIPTPVEVETETPTETSSSIPFSTSEQKSGFNFLGSLKNFAGAVVSKFSSSSSSSNSPVTTTTITTPSSTSTPTISSGSEEQVVDLGTTTTASTSSSSSTSTPSPPPPRPSTTPPTTLPPPTLSSASSALVVTVPAPVVQPSLSVDIAIQEIPEKKLLIFRVEDSANKRNALFYKVNFAADGAMIVSNQIDNSSEENRAVKLNFKSNLEHLSQKNISTTIDNFPDTAVKAKLFFETHSFTLKNENTAKSLAEHAKNAFSGLEVALTAKVKKAKNGSGDLYVDFKDVQNNHQYYRVQKNADGTLKVEISDETDYNNKASKITGIDGIPCKAHKLCNPITHHDFYNEFKNIAGNAQLIKQTLEQHCSPDVSIAIQKNNDGTLTVRVMTNKETLFFDVTLAQDGNHTAVVSTSEHSSSFTPSNHDQFQNLKFKTTTANPVPTTRAAVLTFLRTNHSSNNQPILTNMEDFHKVDAVDVSVRKAQDGSLYVKFNNAAVGKKTIVSYYRYRLGANNAIILELSDKDAFRKASNLIMVQENNIDVSAKKYSNPISQKNKAAFEAFLTDHAAKNVVQEINKLLSPNVELAAQNNMDGTLTLRIDNGINKVSFYSLSLDNTNERDAVVTLLHEDPESFDPNMDEFPTASVHTTTDSHIDNDVGDNDKATLLLQENNLLQRMQTFLNTTNDVHIELKKAENGNIIVKVQGAGTRNTAYYECFADTNIHSAKITEEQFNALKDLPTPGINLRNIKTNKYSFPVKQADSALGRKYMRQLLKDNNNIKAVIQRNITPTVDIDIDKKNENEYIVRFNTHTTPVTSLFYKLLYDGNPAQFRVTDSGPDLKAGFNPNPAFHKPRVITFEDTFPGKITGNKIEEHLNTDVNVAKLLNGMPEWVAPLRATPVHDYYVWHGIVFEKQPGANFKPVFELKEGEESLSTGKKGAPYVHKLTEEQKKRYKHFAQFVKKEGEDAEFFKMVKLSSVPQDKQKFSMELEPGISTRKIFGPPPKAEYIFFPDYTAAIRWLVPVEPKHNSVKLAKFFNRKEAYGIPSEAEAFSYLGNWSEGDTAHPGIKINYFDSAAVGVINISNIRALYKSYFENSDLITTLLPSARVAALSIEDSKKKQKEQTLSVQKAIIDHKDTLFRYGSESAPFEFGLESGFEKIDKENERLSDEEKLEKHREIQQKALIYAPLDSMEAGAAPVVNPLNALAPLIAAGAPGAPAIVDAAEPAKVEFKHLSAEDFKDNVLKLNAPVLPGNVKPFKEVPNPAEPTKVKFQKELDKWASTTRQPVTLDFKFDPATNKIEFSRNTDAKVEIELAALAKLYATEYGVMGAGAVILSQYTPEERLFFRNQVFELMGYKKDPSVIGLDADGKEQFRYVNTLWGDPKNKNPEFFIQDDCNIHIFESQADLDAKIDAIIAGRPAYQEQKEKVDNENAERAQAAAAEAEAARLAEGGGVESDGAGAAPRH